MGSTLAPGFLVAAPSLLDPNFHRTVVLLVDHRAEGSLGFVVNRPAEEQLHGMLEPLGLDLEESALQDAPVLIGGPVLPNTGWIVFEHKDSPLAQHEDVIKVSDNLAVSASRELLETLAQADRSERLLLVLGYAGWGPSQLDNEIAQGSWIPVDFNHEIVFDTPYEDRWNLALRSLGIDPARLAAAVPSES